MSIRSRESRPKKEDLWIGLVHVKQPNRNGVLGNADQAYANVVALAVDKRDLRMQIRKALDELGLNLIKLEDAEPMAMRLTKHSVHKKLHGLADEVKRDRSVRFDVFQTFEVND